MPAGPLFQAEAAKRLRAELPAWSASDSDADQARSMLHLLLDQMERSAPPAPEPLDPRGCPNCGRVVSSTRTPYCSVECREEAGFIRQFRGGLAEGSVFDADRQVAFGQILWFLLGGGRPLRRGLVPEKVIEKVIAKAEGKCADCGAPAVTIDHIGTACNRPINLRPVCSDCCRIVAFGDPGLLSRPDVQEKLARLAERIAAPVSLRPCDAGTWDWRAYINSRTRVEG